ncbi:MAG: hypothetical protein LBE17_00470 [Treponema sp.]|nr:hypothetical protein [Treponema sp.]
MKVLLIWLILALSSVVCFADGAGGNNAAGNDGAGAGGGKAFSLAPVLLYRYVSLDGQQFHASAGALAFTKGNLSPSPGEERNSFLLMAMAGQYFFMREHASGYAGLYHDMGLFAEGRFRRHQVLGLLQSASAEPFYGGLRTVQAGAGYGYEVLRTQQLSLTLGGMLAVSEFGLEYADGKSWPVIPLPVIRFSLNSPFITLDAEFVAEPSLKCTLLPEGRVRVVTETRMHRYRNVRDVIFDGSLWYRFFDRDSKRGDFAGIGIGANSNSAYFTFGEKDKTYELQYFSVYGKLDLSFLNLSGGYAFGGRELFDGETTRGAGDGFFAAVQLAYRF